MLARGKVRYVGEPVAAVAATDAATARAPRPRSRSTTSRCPPYLRSMPRSRTDAPILHEEFAAYVKTIDGGGRGNVVFESSVTEGDVERAFAECDAVVEQTFETQAQHHVYLETNGCVADVDAGGRITLYVTCQSVHHVQQRVAEELGEPMARIRVIATRVGGAFGGKHASNIHSIAAWLARAARRPVKLVLSRMQDFEIQRCRHPARIWMKTGAAPTARSSRATCGSRSTAARMPTRARRARLRAADVARSLPHSQRPRAGQGRVHEQAPRGFLPRLRQPAGDLRGRIAARRSRREARPRSVRAAAAQRDAPE